MLIFEWNWSLPIWWLFKFKLLFRFDIEWMSCGCCCCCCLESIIMAEPDEFMRPELACGWFLVIASAVELVWRWVIALPAWAADATPSSFWLLSWLVTALLLFPLLLLLVWLQEEEKKNSHFFKLKLFYFNKEKKFNLQISNCSNRTDSRT